MNRIGFGLALGAIVASTPLVAQQDSVVVRFEDVELRAVFQGLGRYLDRPLLVGNVPGTRVTLDSPTPMAQSSIAGLIRGLAETHDLEFVADSAFYRVRQIDDSRRGRDQGTAEPDSQPIMEMNVLKLSHARASAIASTVGQLYGVVGGGGSAGFSDGTLSDELRRNNVSPNDTPDQSAPISGPASASISGPVNIVPDEMTNSLLVRSTARDFELIKQAVEQLDVRPLQVLVQVMIVEMRKSSGFNLGVDGTFGGVSIDNGDGELSGSLLGGGGLGDFALQVMKLGSFDLDGILSTSVASGDARILSRPVLLAANNHEARILVGSQRPFVQVSRSLPTDSPTRDQVVQYRDVGTRLTVLPTINADGYVSLLIRQEVNAATAETQFDAPVISTRETETVVLVRNEQTVVLGGLKEMQREITKSGIPILSQIPLVGGLFGSERTTETETELFFFITPTILDDDEITQEVSERMRDDALQSVEGLWVDDTR